MKLHIDITMKDMLDDVCCKDNTEETNARKILEQLFITGENVHLQEIKFNSDNKIAIINVNTISLIFNKDILKSENSLDCIINSIICYTDMLTYKSLNFLKTSALFELKKIKRNCDSFYYRPRIAFKTNNKKYTTSFTNFLFISNGCTVPPNKEFHHSNTVQDCTCSSLYLMSKQEHGSLPGCSTEIDIIHLASCLGFTRRAELANFLLKCRDLLLENNKKVVIYATLE